VKDTGVVDVPSDRPGILFTDAKGAEQEVRCDYLVGADGSHSVCRKEIPTRERKDYFRQYPFAWFGILCDAPKSAPELIYNHSDRGFALISQRTETVQRMYFQCDLAENVDAWSDDRIWAELQARVGANGHILEEGPITSKSVLPFRSYVCEPMRFGNLLLAGDAAHTLPPTGAKGLNLALADVKVLAEILERAVTNNDHDVLAEYSDRALTRVWKAQHFSYWMTTMLHQLPDASSFDVARQLAELSSVVGSRAGSTYLAEAYTGWPIPGSDNPSGLTRN
jgi:p-hydroxybenzoate 3-monooxygenase